MNYRLSPQFKANINIIEARLDILETYDKKKYTIYREVLNELGFKIKIEVQEGYGYHKLYWTMPVYYDTNKRLVCQEGSLE